MEQNSKIDPYKFDQQILDKGAKATQWRKDSPFNKQCWHGWTQKGKNNEP